MHPSELLARAAFMQHDDQGHNALKQYAALRGLRWGIGRCMEKCSNKVIYNSHLVPDLPLGGKWLAGGGGAGGVPGEGCSCRPMITQHTDQLATVLI